MIVGFLLETEALAIGFVRHDGLRVLVELSLMQQLGGVSTDTSAREIAQTEACLSRLLGYSKGVASVICDEGGVGIMLDLLRDTDSVPIVTLALKVLSYLANGEAAQDILETEGTRIISRWVRGDTDASGDPEARIWVRMPTKSFQHPTTFDTTSFIFHNSPCPPHTSPSLTSVPITA